MNIQKGFLQRLKGGVRFLSIPSFEQLGGVCCAFSTRIGGVSPKPYDTLNLSRKRGNTAVSFSENLRRFGSAAGFDPKQAVCINYAHSASVYHVCDGDAGRGITRKALPQICDGLYTDCAGLPLISFHADCVPLFFYDPERRAAAVCHAGWRGVAAHIAKNTTAALIGIGCRAEHIRAAVGPCISVKHFEVGEDVRNVFLDAFGRKAVAERDGRLYVNLNQACVLDMVHAGIEPAHITDAALCTFGDAHLFFSHRRDRGRTGAMAAFIALQND